MVGSPVGGIAVRLHDVSVVLDVKQEVALGAQLNHTAFLGIVAAKRPEEPNPEPECHLSSCMGD